jgi:hypothetical protein
MKITSPPLLRDPFNRFRGWTLGSLFSGAHDRPERAFFVALQQNRWGHTEPPGAVVLALGAPVCMWPRVLVDTDDTKTIEKQHRHDTEGM